MPNPTICRKKVLSMQLCVPKDWTESKILEFAENRVPCGIESGWYLCKKDDPVLDGAEDRVSCDDRSEYVHVVVSC
jgi:hypothetical protein